MNKADVSLLKENLYEHANRVYGWFRSEEVSKANFLHDLFCLIDSLVRHNREDPLIQNAVLDLEHGDLIFREFLILSILYGSYAGTPHKVSILKDIVGMLDKDLNEEELTVCAYADGKTVAFFPELHEVWKNIREIYGAKEFDSAALPPTPYRAYALIALNRQDGIMRKIHHEELFHELCVLQGYMEKIYSLINSQPKRR